MRRISLISSCRSKTTGSDGEKVLRGSQILKQLTNIANALLPQVCHHLSRISQIPSRNSDLATSSYLLSA